MEDEYSGEKSVVSDQPTAADYEPVVTVFRSLAALGVVYGMSGIIFLPLGLLRFHQGAIPGDFRVHLFDAPIRSTSIEALWLLCSSLCGVGLGTALVVGALGGLRLKSWSFHVLKLWAIASIALGALGSFFYFQWILPPWRDRLSEVRGVDDSLVNLGGWMIGSLLAIGMLIVIQRREVREALQRDGRVISAENESPDQV